MSKVHLSLLLLHEMWEPFQLPNYVCRTIETFKNHRKKYSLVNGLLSVPLESIAVAERSQDVHLVLLVRVLLAVEKFVVGASWLGALKVLLACLGA